MLIGYSCFPVDFILKHNPVQFEFEYDGADRCAVGLVYFQALNLLY